MSDEYVIVLSTLPGNVDPGKIARTLVEERLAACVNILPEMTSIYRWAGTVEEETERQVLMKTTRNGVRALRERLRGLHPYDVPEFIVVPIVEGDETYLKWVGESVAHPGASNSRT